MNPLSQECTQAIKTKTSRHRQAASLARAWIKSSRAGDPQVILRDQNGLKLIEMKRAMDRVLVDAGPKGLSSREIAESIEALEESVIDATVSPKTVSNYLRRYGEAMDWHKFGPSPRYTRWRKGQLVQMSAHLGAGATTENPSEGEGGPS